MRRHLLAVTAVLIITAGAAYEIRSTPPLYSRSATVEFIVTGSPADANLKAPLVAPLIATEVMMAQIMTSPAAVGEVRAAGGNAEFGIEPENLYSLQYPDYSEPSAMLTVTSPDTAAVGRTFGVVLRLLGQRLASMQAGVPPRHRVQISLVSDTGALAQPGSRTRVLGGLALLALAALLMVPSFLDRHPGLTAALTPPGWRRRPAAAMSDP